MMRYACASLCVSNYAATLLRSYLHPRNPYPCAEGCSTQTPSALSRRTKVYLILVESLGTIYYASKRQNSIPFPSAHPAPRLFPALATDVPPLAPARSLMQHHSHRLSFPCSAVMTNAAAICKKVVALEQQACPLVFSLSHTESTLDLFLVSATPPQSSCAHHLCVMRLSLYLLLPVNVRNEAKCEQLHRPRRHRCRQSG